METLTLKERAAHISEAANRLSDELARTGFPEPSFELGLPPPLSNDAPETPALRSKLELLQMVDELRSLLTDPTLQLTSQMRNPALSVHPIIRLGIAENFPPEGTTVQDLASKLHLPESLVGRLLSHSATYHIYHESSPGYFVHTAASRALSENDGMRQYHMVGLEETLPATCKTASALVQDPLSEEPESCGWSIQNDTELSLFKALANMPDRANTFAEAMRWQSTLPGFSHHHLTEVFPWGSSEQQLTVVDVGGGVGQVSQALLDHSPDVKCIVQDYPEVVSRGQDSLPAKYKPRITFQSHDFFKEQPIKGADIYLLRMILHDWSDKYAIKIIQALVPALKPGAKVVINDRVIPAWHQAHYLVEREARDSDMYMLAFQNARERTAQEWSALLKRADGRFQLTRVHQPPRSVLAVVEVTWDG
ncbi:O-methyltransferase-domain-containing protein [Talaromyces proteolyticus]|uniref:O-methyltransferase-domain-containing protein n=1 Tax=Talaromyces proteolyticus TaxID=1131652 RepID=A0AAD4KR19_9EURO|nr:O-methyltransferase-domain-containing protein [Talaromyces proteolyticus]KAH8694169.1 O-methyltransferase-domain-containing protein [Talaromyces proteolyticus]